MEEKKKNRRFSIAFCGGMIMIFAIIAYFINITTPTSSSYAYITVVGPVFFLIGFVIFIIGLVIGIIISQVKKK